MQVDYILFRLQKFRFCFKKKKKKLERVKFHGRIYQLVKEAKRNKTCNFPFSEKKKVNYLKRPIMEAEINIALKIG